MLCQHLSIFSHAGTRLALEHAVLLRGAGHEVRVFSAQEMTNVGIARWLGCPRQVILRRRIPRPGSPCPPTAAFQASAAPDTWPMLGRWRRTAAEVAAFAPDAVLFVGFFSPLLTWAYRHFPVAGMSVHTLPPLGPVDVWLHQYDMARCPRRGAASRRPEPFPYSFRLALPPPHAVTLTSLGLPANALLAVSVGYRLSKEITADFAAQLARAPERHPRWVWLLVGDADGAPRRGPSAGARARRTRSTSTRCSRNAICTSTRRAWAAGSA